MGVTRTQMAFERDYVQIPNAWLRDPELSRRARGLLAELMTHSAGWHITIGSLQRTGPEGRDAIRSAVSELVERGYLIVRQGHGAHGRFNEVEYELSDPTSTGVGKSDTGGFTDSGSADVGESAPKKTITPIGEEPQGENEPSPFCSNHPNGTDGAPCGPCGTARVRHKRWLDAQRPKPMPFPRLEDTPMCPEHPGYPIDPISGSCARCDRERADDASVETTCAENRSEAA